MPEEEKIAPVVEEPTPDVEVSEEEAALNAQDAEHEAMNTRIIGYCDDILDLLVSKDVSLVDLQVIPMYFQNIVKAIWLSSPENLQAKKLEDEYYAKKISEVFKRNDSNEGVQPDVPGV